MGPILFACLCVIGFTVAAHAQEPVRDDEQGDARPPRRLELRAPPLDDSPKVTFPRESIERPLFGGWTVESSATWSDGTGFPISTTTPRAGTRPEPSWMIGHPRWNVAARFRQAGPGGLTFTAKAGARRGSMLPPFLTDIIGTNTVIDIPADNMDPASRQTFVDIAAGVERGFDVGPVEIRLFGEGTLAAAIRKSALQPVVPGAGAPMKPDGAALRFGVGLKF